MEQIDRIKKELESLFEGTEDKKTIEALGRVTGILSEIEDVNTKTQMELKDVLKDYKELVKHTSFELKQGQIVDREITPEQPKAPELNDIISQVLAKRK